MKFSSSNNFDLLRLLAATQVVIVHGASFFELDAGVQKFIQLFVSPFPGVPIFFVISGFLITASWMRPHQKINAYALSRFLRIYPALWAAVFLAVVIVLCTSNYPGTTDFFGWLVAQSTILQIYNPDFLRDFGVGVINGSLWTISVEICFYIFVPLFFYLFSASPFKRDVVLLCLFLASFSIYVVAFDLKTQDVFIGKLIFLTIFAHLWQFLMGVFIFLYFEKVRSALEGKVLLWVVLYLALLAIYKSVGMHELKMIVLLAARLSMACFVISFAFSYTAVLQKGTRWLGGDYSYGTYLFHALYINLMVEYNLSSGLGALGLLLLLTYLTAYLSWQYIESPALKYKSMLLSR